MKKGDWVQTPRFCGVRIDKVFRCEDNARKAGYKEPTYYDSDANYGILGKSLDMYHMRFAAYRK